MILHEVMPVDNPPLHVCIFVVQHLIVVTPFLAGPPDILPVEHCAILADGIYRLLVFRKPRAHDLLLMA